MRMWMVNPRIMCRQHLLGEHLECHMFLGHIRRGKALDGYANNNLFSMGFLFKRHMDLVEEMWDRGYNHHSPLETSPLVLDNMNEMYRHLFAINVDAEEALVELLARCDRCKARFENVLPEL